MSNKWVLTLFSTHKIMSSYKPTVFNQIFRIMRDHIKPFVGQLDKYSKVMSCENLAKVLLYAQITWKESLRDIETGLQCEESKLYHLWIKSTARSTIAYWNSKVDSSVYEQVFYEMMGHYKSVCLWRDNGLWITTIALDGSVISLALSVFDWAKHRTTKWWIKLHVWLDIDTYLPRFMTIRDAKQWENLIAKEMVEWGYLKKWEMIVFDRYYVDFELWKLIDGKWSSFVTRTKKNTDYVIVEENEIGETWIISDSKAYLMWEKGRKLYKKPLRIVRYYDKESEREFEYITNNFDLKASQIADIYKNRWKVEEFFRWIKQNLKIKSFLWTSENAVKNQIWIAMIYYLVLQYLRSIARLWRNQVLKLSRIIHAKCMIWIGISELFALCRSKTNKCLSVSTWPPNSLFNF